LAYKIDRRTGRVWQLRYSEQTEIYETQKSETALPPKLITWKDFAESKGYSDAATEEQFKIRKDFFENILRKDPEFPKDEVASLEVERRFAELIGGAVSENNIDDRIQKALGNRAIEMVKRSKVIRSGFISLHK